MSWRRFLIGCVAGRHPARRSEAVVYTAHYDHLGIGPAVNGDSIYNGAVEALPLDRTLELVNDPNIIPTSLRKTQIVVIQEVLEMKEAVGRDITRERKLDRALADMEKVISEGKIREAFAVRQTLLEEFPGLAGHAEIVQKVQQIGERERDLVKTTDRLGGISCRS